MPVYRPVSSPPPTGHPKPIKQDTSSEPDEYVCQLKSKDKKAPAIVPKEIVTRLGRVIRPPRRMEL